MQKSHRKILKKKTKKNLIEMIYWVESGWRHLTFCRTAPRLRSDPVKWWSCMGQTFPGTLCRNKRTTVVGKADLCSMKEGCKEHDRDYIAPPLCLSFRPNHTDLLYSHIHLHTLNYSDVWCIDLNKYIAWEQNNNNNNLLIKFNNFSLLYSTN